MGTDRIQFEEKGREGKGKRREEMSPAETEAEGGLRLTTTHHGYGETILDKTGRSGRQKVVTKRNVSAINWTR
jgi:hypothetical protein